MVSDALNIQRVRCELRVWFNFCSTWNEMGARRDMVRDFCARVEWVGDKDKGQLRLFFAVVGGTALSPVRVPVPCRCPFHLLEL
jgi:hypothetical protein